MTLVGVATKRYAVTLPEGLAEEVRRKVGPRRFSEYVAGALMRQWKQDRPEGVEAEQREAPPG
ncbi:hypothetical protein GCM10010094_36500 [Streptomyces flaveus]|uniref:Uncharacterized protein n=1 Tax=Streptomyces flaveus TaxID=66370 RepID=A0A917VFW1_9ACTN|nr:hypothetical protein GCM10010094_36500 [Streptomyces flaveus]